MLVVPPVDEPIIVNSCFTSVTEYDPTMSQHRVNISAAKKAHHQK